MIKKVAKNGLFISEGLKKVSKHANSLQKYQKKVRKPFGAPVARLKFFMGKFITTELKIDPRL